MRNAVRGESDDPLLFSDVAEAVAPVEPVEAAVPVVLDPGEPLRNNLAVKHHVDIRRRHIRSTCSSRYRVCTRR